MNEAKSSVTGFHRHPASAVKPMPARQWRLRTEDDQSVDSEQASGKQRDSGAARQRSSTTG